jgi:hypothetical protein
MDGKKYNRKHEEAARLRIGTRSLERWVVARVVPVHRVGRVLLFNPVETDAALGRFRVAAVGEFRQRQAKRRAVAVEG